MNGLPSTDPIVVAPERPDQPEIVAMIETLDALSASLYPPESNHLVDVAALCAPAVIFLVARRAGIAVGCGAVVEDVRGWGEIKRMFVEPLLRRRGVGGRILAALEARAAERGLDLMRLETGIHNSEALAAYRRAGYRECPPFGDYRPDPLSVFMEKRLDRRGVTAAGASR